MRRNATLGSALALAVTAAATLTFSPPTALATSSGSGADNARVIGTLTIQGFSPSTTIPVRSYGWAMQVPTDAASGSATGTAQWSDVTLTKSVDSVSPQLLLAAARGTRFTNATLVVYRPGSTETLARYTFGDVLLSAKSANDLGRSNGFPIEGLSLNWRRITVQVGNGPSVCWDRSTRALCN